MTREHEYVWAATERVAWRHRRGPATQVSAQGIPRASVVPIAAERRCRGPERNSADVGFHGSTQVRTPHIDKLAAEGVVLDRYYVQAECSPTRASILTGRHVTHTGWQGALAAGHTLDAVGRPYGVSLRYSMLPQFLKEKFPDRFPEDDSFPAPILFYPFVKRLPLEVIRLMGVPEISYDDTDSKVTTRSSRSGPWPH